MNIVVNILIILHFIGLAFLLGAFLYQIKDIVAGKGKIVRGILDGALTQIVTGIALVGIYSAGLVEDEEVDNAKIGVKLLFVIAVYVLALVFRKRVTAPSWAMWLIGGLTLANVVIAVVW